MSPSGETTTWGHQSRVPDQRLADLFGLARMTSAEMAVPGAALGTSSPRAFVAELQRLNSLAAAWAEGWALACDIAAADQAESPDPRVWASALAVLAQMRAPLPLMMPLQMGGLSAEWHEGGFNIELRFRPNSEPYLVLEDVKGEVPSHYGRDFGLQRAVNALTILSTRLRE